MKEGLPEQGRVDALVRWASSGLWKGKSETADADLLK